MIARAMLISSALAAVLATGVSPHSAPHAEVKLTPHADVLSHASAHKVHKVDDLSHGVGLDSPTHGHSPAVSDNRSNKMKPSNVSWLSPLSSWHPHTQVRARACPTRNVLACADNPETLSFSIFSAGRDGPVVRVDRETEGPDFPFLPSP